jgi:hypothetical protein
VFRAFREIRATQDFWETLDHWDFQPQAIRVFKDVRVLLSRKDHKVHRDL